MYRVIPALMVSRTAPDYSGPFYRSITLDQPVSDLTNFPVLISGTFSYLATVANGGKVKNANGYDIGFYSDSSLTTKLKWETESYSATTGAVTYWVKIPTLTSASATVIYIRYGDSTITTDQSDPTNVWDTNYKAVWHLSQSSSPATDSTSTGANMSASGSPTFGATGKIYKGISFANNISDFLSVNSATLELSSAVSVEAWVNVNSISNLGFFDKTIGGATNKQYQLFFETIAFKWRVVKGGTLQTIASDSAPSTSTWYHLVGTYDGSTMRMYVNGVLQAATLSVTAPIDTGSGVSIIGELGSSVFAMNGTLEEIRVSSSERNGNWISTSYSNQNDPANFYVIGSESRP